MAAAPLKSRASRIRAANQRSLALQALALGATRRQAAATAGVPESRIIAYQNDPGWAMQLQAQRQAMARDGAARLEALVSAAADSFARCLHPDVDLRLQLDAASKLIAGICRLSEVRLAWAQSDRGMSAQDIAAEMGRIRDQLLALPLPQAQGPQGVAAPLAQGPQDPPGSTPAAAEPQTTTAKPSAQP